MTRLRMIRVNGAVRLYVNRKLSRLSFLIRENALFGKIVRGAAWSLAGSALTRCAALLTSVLIARTLGKSGYGELGAVQATIGMFGTLGGFTMGTTAAKFIGELQSIDPERISSVISLSRLVALVSGCGLAGAMVFSSPYIAESSLNAPHLRSVLKLGALVVALTSINGAQNGVLSGFQSFKELAVSNVCSAIVALPITVGLGAVAGVKGALIGIIVGQGVNCSVSGAYIYRTLRRRDIAAFDIVGWKREMPILWRFSLPAVLGGLLNGPVQWLCTSMLVTTKGMAEVGLFNAANQWFNAILWLPYVIAQSLLPVFSEQFGANDYQRAGRILRSTVLINAVAAVPVISIGCALSPLVMRSYGPTFSEGWPILALVIITGGIAMVQIPVGNVLAASGRMWLGFGMNIVWAIVVVIGSWVMLRWGAVGVATARLFAYIAQGIVALPFAVRIVSTKD